MHGTGNKIRGQTGKNLQQVQNHKAKVTEHECSTWINRMCK